jgi:predicted TIM-barrel fold metal-dependent hydrolase
LPVVFHLSHTIKEGYGLGDDLGLPRLEKLLQKCSDTIFCAHGPAFWAEMSTDVDDKTRGGYPNTAIKEPGRVSELLEKYPNLYGDLSANSGYNALIRTPEYGFEFLKKFRDKLLFATDTMYYDMDDDKTPIIGYMKDNLTKGNVTENVYKKITYNNAAHLLNLKC